MQKAGKILGRILIGVLILAILAGAGGMYYFKSYLPKVVAPKSFPQIDGEIQVDGLDGPVDVIRDQMGIPHIYATTSHDLFFAQGYVHAQERFWQMDFWRHIGSGRLSEMFASEVDTDAFLRTLGWKQTAEAEWAELGPDTRAILQSYADGVNAYLKDHKGEDLSLEYAILGLPILSPNYEVEEWTPINSLTWGKAMAWDLRGNMDEEIQRAVLLKTLTPEQVAQLFPPYPEDHPVIVNKIGEGAPPAATPAGLPPELDLAALQAVEQNIALLNPMLGKLGDGIGSNSWVVSGKLSATGAPLLANDPHLGIQMPSIWFQVALHCVKRNANCPFEVAGFSFAGVPGVVIGHNDRIAWGFTNVGPDVMDLYIEKVNPDNPNQYEVNGTWVDFKTREEVIKTANGDSVTITVRSTRHGPVISDTYGPLKDQGDPKDEDFVPFKDRTGVDVPKNYVIALAWTALTPSTPFEAIWGFDKAQNWEEFRKAASAFHVPAQNLVYADIEGNIGYQMPGDVPIRAKGDGTIPVPGWTDEYEWTGMIPFEELPYTLNPAEGYIATANNQVPPRDYPHFITYDWDYGFRADRIVNLIESAPNRIDMEYIQTMHGDSYDANAAVFAPLLLNLKLASDLTPAQDTLKNWDYQDRADSTSAAVFNAFWRSFLKNTFNDDMPEERYYPDGGSRWNEVMRNMVKDPKDPFWDDKTTPDVIETMDFIMKKSFADGVAELKDTFGSDLKKWNWGDMHASTFRNGTLGESGISFIEDLFNRGPYPTSGGEALVNATGWSVVDGYETNWLPSMRQIIDLQDLNNSITVHTTGESGHAYHKHYDDMAPLWANIEYYPMWWNLDSVLADAEGHLILKP